MITARGRLLVARVAALALRDARPRLSRSLHQVGTGTDLTVARRGWGSPFGSSTTRVQRISYRFPSLNADVTPPSEADVAEPVSSAADVAEPASSAADVADSLPSNLEVVEVESDGSRLDPSRSSTAVAAAAAEETSEHTSEVTSLAAEGAMSSSSAAEEATSSAATIEQAHTAMASSSTTQTIDSTSSSSPASAAAAPEISFAQQRMKETLQEAHLQDLSSSGGAVYARIENSPKYILKSDILRYFEGSGLKSENIALSYDPRYRAKHWYAEFESMKQYNIATGMTVTRKSMWTRPIRLIRVKKERMLLELRAAADLANFRDRSLILINLPEDVKIHDIERLFDGNRIAAHGIKLFTIMHEIVKTPPRLRLQGERRHELHNIMEKRAVVKFESELEALRALREKQGDFVFDREVQLKFLR